MTKSTRINNWNISLMIISCAAAFIMPFEVFLFAYAFLGPLHYLTEISWLHNRNYFSKGKYDYVFLVVIGVIISWEYLASRYQMWPYYIDGNINENLYSLDIGNKILLLAFFGAIILAFVKNTTFKIISLLLVFAFINNWLRPDEAGTQKDSTILYVLTSFVPTLIHVYIFTGFFILFGALKERSISGLVSFFVFIICPVLLVVLFRDETFIGVTEYGKQAYGNSIKPDGFFDLSQGVLQRVVGVAPDLSQYKQSLNGISHDSLVAMAQKTSPEVWSNWAGLNNIGEISQINDDKAIKSILERDFLHKNWNDYVYIKSAGILLMRFIAFAYLYHYLNWFSKTEVIKWHEVSKTRLAVIVGLWLFSIGIYAYDYAMGLQWLFFLSFTHVLLEFPLNFISIVGIGKETVSIFKNGFKPKAA